MVRPGAATLPDTPGSPNEAIATLVREFQQAPYDWFREEELHARFYSLCRDAFPRYPISDGREVATFRHAYPTTWHYEAGDRFAERNDGVGNVATFDFAVLRRGFVHRSDYLTVVNGDQQRREQQYESSTATVGHTSQAVQCAIELKMTHLRDAKETNEADVNRLEDRMLAACCKLAQERIKQAYVIGFSQGPLPDASRAQSFIAGCLRIHGARQPDGSLCVLVATPTETVLGGAWPEGVEFPNVVPPVDE